MTVLDGLHGGLGPAILITGSCIKGAGVRSCHSFRETESRDENLLTVFRGLLDTR